MEGIDRYTVCCYVLSLWIRMCNSDQKFNGKGTRGAQFAHCEFSPIRQQALFTTLNTAKEGAYVLKWDIGVNWSAKMAKKRKVATDAVSSFAMSTPGDMIAVGTAGGDIMVRISNSFENVVKLAFGVQLHPIACFLRQMFPTYFRARYTLVVNIQL